MSDLTKMSVAELLATITTMAKWNSASACDAAKELARRAEANERLVDFTGAFEKLREALGSWLGTSGGLCAILDGIESLREEAETKDVPAPADPEREAKIKKAITELIGAHRVDAGCGGQAFPPGWLSQKRDALLALMRAPDPEREAKDGGE